ncbi:MAG TPA: bifunctional transaldolase/phosoglucose isomerase [Ktedonobacterales bacterium]|nr:bifunctional transaldolase/phosoglucose isomerase [Ktedonobacterales bacterium]
MAKSRLHEVYELGQSVWYDNIRRGLITSGDLQKLVDDDAVVGVTSNPTIFERAIDGSTDYDDQMKDLVRQGVADPYQIFEELAVTDIQMTADVLRPIYEATNGIDGYISLEVSPAAARDTTRTIAEARRLFKHVDRPNVMIKIPATPEGIPAIEQMIYEGVNINVTLIFSLDRYVEVTEAYIRGLEHRSREGQPVTGIASVASFFVSRVDTLVDKLLDEKINQESDPERRQALDALHGRAAIANARLAYEKYQRIFNGERFKDLRAQGAAPQRCLWASTSTKNPAYRDVLYVEALIGPETVDTMPPQTIVAFQDHGVAQPTLTLDLPAMHETMDQMARSGIDMDAVTHQLEVEGVKSFADSFGQLIAATREKAERLQREAQGTSEVVGSTSNGGSSDSSALTGGSAPSLAKRQGASLGTLQGAVDETLDRADRERFAARVWGKDPTLWKPNPDEQQEITDRLGWLTVMEQMADVLPRLNDLRDDVRQAGFTHAVLLGMGGSSLAPEVLKQTFGVAAGQPQLLVLDSTDPATIQDVLQVIDLPHTLFIVASKSGGTIETLSQFKYFYDRVGPLVGQDEVGRHFLAITDPGTKLDKMAQDMKFRATFRNPPDIGGRYSALSYFGLVPAAIIGLDIRALLDRAETMCQACQPSVSAHENPGVWLGSVMGTLAREHRDKLTIVVSPPIGSVGSWLEQLLAESTGKEGKGILPVDGEALGTPEVYSDDRLFVYLRTDVAFDPEQDAAVDALEAAGQPIVRLTLKDAFDVGAEFFRWEFATAVAGAILGINAFDQPNVQESKDNTERLLRQYEESKELPTPRAILQTQTLNVALVAGGEIAARLRDSVSLQAALETYARMAGPDDYFALLAYVQRTRETEGLLQHIRVRLRDSRRVATTLGYGPRFQHSTGQFHKGGPNTGVFIQFVATDAVDLSIPGEPYTFSVLKQAQALGDLQSLEAHHRRVIRIDLGANIVAGLREIEQALDAADLS